MSASLPGTSLVPLRVELSESASAENCIIRATRIRICILYNLGGKDMFKVNDNYLKLPGSYLFSTIGKKVRAYQEANPDKEICLLYTSDAADEL